MGSIWVKEFTGGLDSRRMPEATSGGVLVVANNGHVTRGGEFEQRASFVPHFTLPAGTVDLFYTASGLCVFGHASSPVMPSGVAYQRLQHPTPGTALVRVLSADLYQSKIYAVGQFADGSVYHFYDGVVVEDWFDGRARAAFDVRGGFSIGATAATGSFEVTGGTAGGGNQINTITVAGIDVLGAVVAHTGDNGTTAAALASQINSFTSSPDYTASAVGAVVALTASALGTAANGRVVSGTVSGTATIGNFSNMAGGTAASASQLSGLTVDGVSIISAPVSWSGSDENTAALIAAEVNGHTSSPDYNALADGVTVNIIAASAGPGPNGFSVSVDTASGLVVSPTTTTLENGGTFGGAAAVGAFTIGAGTGGSTIVPRVAGVSLVAAPVAWTTNSTLTAAAIAAAINAHVSVPDYAATSLGAVVTLATATNTGAYNGLVPTFTITGTFPVSNVVALAGGHVDDAFTPGSFVKTIGSKMYSVAGPSMHFSGIRAPTFWTTDTIGAGFIDMSSESSGSENLTALARYQNLVAVFAPRIVQIWYVDPDPELNRKSQELNNTGTSSPKSVTSFGDTDLFYLDESGLRSLRARDSSNAAATTDIGVPVDSLITEKLALLTDEERSRVTGLIEPRAGRFWLVMKDQVFVFSFFNGAKVSAWSTYSTTYVGEDGEPVSFDVDNSVVFNRRVYLRSGNTIYVYGGTGNTTTHDATVAEAWLPYLDGNEPSRLKTFSGVDVALRGLWQVFGALDPGNEAAEDRIAVSGESTFNSQKIPFNHEATHVSLRFRSDGVGPHRLGSCLIHYTSDEDED